MPEITLYISLFTLLLAAVYAISLRLSKGVPWLTFAFRTQSSAPTHLATPLEESMYRPTIYPQSKWRSCRGLAVAGCDIDTDNLDQIPATVSPTTSPRSTTVGGFRFPQFCKFGNAAT